VTAVAKTTTTSIAASAIKESTFKINLITKPVDGERVDRMDGIRNWLELHWSEWMQLRLPRVNLRWVGLILVMTVLALGSWPRLSNLDQPPLWDDERNSLIGATGQTAILPFSMDDVTVEKMLIMWTPGIPGLRTGFTPADVWAKDNIANIIEATQYFDGGNALLFNVMLHYWIEPAGLDDFSLKLLPALLGLATLAVIFFGLRLVGAGLLAATLACFVAALHPLLIWSSRELRSYALAAMLVVVATFILLRLVEECKARRPSGLLTLAYAVVAAAALMSHYLTAYIFVGHGIWALLTLRNRRAWLHLTLAGAIVGGAFILWLLTGGADGIKLMDIHNVIWQQRAQAGHFPWLSVATTQKVASAFITNFAQYLLLQSTYAYDQFLLRSAPAIVVKWGLFLLALGAIGTSFVIAVHRRNDRLASLKLLTLILAVAAPAFAVALSFRSGHTLPFTFRYMVFSAPFAAMFVGLCGAALVDRTAWKRPSLFTALPLQALIFIAALIHLETPERFIQSPDARGDIYFKAATRVAEVAQPNDLVVYANAYDALIVSLYLRGRPSLHSIVEDQNPNGRPAVVLRRGDVEIKLADKLYQPE
jgi:uncharacterized membrane protein